MRYAIEDEFRLSECGYDSPKFLGKCPECGEWNTLKEFKIQSSKVKIDSAFASISSEKEKSVKNSQKSLTKTKTGCLPGLKK